MSFRRSLMVVASAGAFLVSANAMAQDAEKQPGSNDKKAQEFLAKGVPVGSFTLFPRLTVKETYNSNIYKEKDSEDSDWITDIEPSLKLKSDWNRHSLQFGAKANVGLYNDDDENDYEDYNINADGSIDVSKALTIKGKAAYNHGHEDKGDDDVTSNAKNPVETDTTSGSLTVTYKPNRLGLEFGAAYKDLGFDDNVNVNGTTTNNDDRDRTELLGTVKVSYELKKGYEAYVRGQLNDRDYDDNLDDNGLNRDSDGYNAQAGLAIDLAKLVRADVAVGYMSQEYSDASLSDASGWSADLGAKWFVTPITTITGKVARTIDETTTANVSSTVGTKYALGVRHEILRNWRVFGNVSLSETDYEGSTRNDDKWVYKLGTDYKLNRNFFAGASVEHENRDSNDSANDYDRNLYMIKIGAQF